MKTPEIGCIAGGPLTVVNIKPASVLSLLFAAVIVLTVFCAQAGVVLTTLYSFTGGHDAGVGIVSEKSRPEVTRQPVTLCAIFPVASGCKHLKFSEG